MVAEVHHCCRKFETLKPRELDAWLRGKTCLEAQAQVVSENKVFVSDVLVEPFPMRALLQSFFDAAALPDTSNWLQCLIVHDRGNDCQTSCACAGLKSSATPPPIVCYWWSLLHGP
jgi:hypothetical protein